MSKHPIDDLFADQLRNHGVKPERATWEELQRRMNGKQKNRVPFTIWYASAASVAVVVLASWWLWSVKDADKTDLATNQIVRHVPEKTTPTRQMDAVEETKVPVNNRLAESSVMAYQKPVTPAKRKQNDTDRQPSASAESTKPVMPQDPMLTEPIEMPVMRLAEATPKESERTLIVRIATPEMKTADEDVDIATESKELAAVDDSAERPQKKRFRLGRVLRQINKLKAGEAVEWEDVGVKPGALMARASEKVQEGKVKIADSYENLRYNAFRKNSNNK
ncbi:hypothetical protein GCM10027347_36640 [Larkinella harenae]